MKDVTIVILCDDYLMAERLFHRYLDFILLNTPWDIVSIYETSNMLELTYHIRYLFIDHRFIDWICNEMTDIEVMDQDDFFYDLYSI